MADFFCGGGTTAAVAQRLGRRWMACDQFRVAVAITSDRLIRQVEEQTGMMFPVPDFTVEHWGVYEMRRLAETPSDQFRAFVLRAFGAIPEQSALQSGTGVPPVNQSGMAVPAMNPHGQDAHATIKIRQGAYLPHWTKDGSIYSVTFRLADSLPQRCLKHGLPNGIELSKQPSGCAALFCLMKKSACRNFFQKRWSAIWMPDTAHAG